MGPGIYTALVVSDHFWFTYLCLIWKNNSPCCCCFWRQGRDTVGGLTGLTLWRPALKTVCENAQGKNRGWEILGCGHIAFFVFPNMNSIKLKGGGKISEYNSVIFSSLEYEEPTSIKCPSVTLLGTGYSSPPFKRRTNMLLSLAKPNFCNGITQRKTIICWAALISWWCQPVCSLILLDYLWYLQRKMETTHCHLIPQGQNFHTWLPEVMQRCELVFISDSLCNQR